MTRFDGYRLLACPLCNTVHAKANVVSFNLMAFENWSDGRSVHSLFDNRQGLRQCAGCKDFFLESEATYIGRLSSYESQRQVAPHDIDIPAFLRRDADGESSNQKSALIETLAKQEPKTWLGNLKHWWNKKPSTEKTQPYPSENESFKEESPQYPRLQSVFDSDLATILEKPHSYSTELIISARKLYWMYLNDPYRATARGFIKKGKDPYEAYRPTDLQIENMQLLALMISESSEDYLRSNLAELYRELGEFDKSVHLLQQRASLDIEAETILNAAKDGISAPVPIKYPHQKNH